jgi:hypothetical protein
MEERGQGEEDGDSGIFGISGVSGDTWSSFFQQHDARRHLPADHPRLERTDVP